MQEKLELQYGVKFQEVMGKVEPQLEDRQLFLELQSRSDFLKLEGFVELFD